MEIIRPVEFNKKPTAQATSENKLLLDGPLKFSCDCGHTAELNLVGVIFRHMDFYCSSCGLHYKVTNPAFAVKMPKAPTKPR